MRYRTIDKTIRLLRNPLSTVALFHESFMMMNVPSSRIGLATVVSGIRSLARSSGTRNNGFLLCILWAGLWPNVRNPPMDAA